MLLWVKFGLSVVFGFWGMYAGSRGKDNASHPDQPPSLKKKIVRLEGQLATLSFVVLVAALFFWFVSSVPTGISFLTLSALAYLVGYLFGKS